MSDETGGGGHPEKAEVLLAAATPAERDELLALMRDYFLPERARVLGLMGLGWEEFEALYRTRGEVRTIRRRDATAGYAWIELRDRDLHLHGIFMLPAWRGKGMGSAAIESLGLEFEERADCIELGVHTENRGARALYARLGFVAVRELADLGFVIMRKALRRRVGE